jgi:3-deoxy-7-phosphoheptulonate synthase
MHADLKILETGARTGDAPAEPMISPAALRSLVPQTGTAALAVRSTRTAIRGVLDGTDDRLLMIVGPCSIHDRDAALEYAARLVIAAERLCDDLLIVMRAYVEKSRTLLGWPGMAMAPALDGPPDPVRGFETARSIMAEIVEMGIPIGTEWLNPISPDYLGDLVAWGCVGARSVENQSHRHMASALDMPIGMKNRTDGCVQTAVNAVRVAGQPHAILAVAPDGTVEVHRSTGNPHCHIVLRGGTDGPNCQPAAVRAARRLLRSAELPERLLVDASHGNSGKDHERQLAVAHGLARQIEDGDEAIRGLLLKSFLLPGRQEPTTARQLARGQSVTDPCLGWTETDRLLAEFGRAARAQIGGRGPTQSASTAPPPPGRWR